MVSEAKVNRSPLRRTAGVMIFLVDNGLGLVLRMKAFKRPSD
jgi:hypothetical protein